MKKANESIEGNVASAKGKVQKLRKGNLFVLKDKEEKEYTYAVSQ